MKLRNILIVIGIIAVIGLGYSIFQNTDNAPAEETSTTNDQAPETLYDVTTVIANGTDESTYETSYATQKSALDILLSIASEESFEVKTTDYDFGSIVDSIDGIGEDTSDNKYWIYYVNGETATEGASTYLAEDGDTIKWNYEDAIE